MQSLRFVVFGRMNIADQERLLHLVVATRTLAPP